MVNKRGQDYPYFQTLAPLFFGNVLHFSSSRFLPVLEVAMINAPEHTATEMKADNAILL